jgi:hypothetical protein
MIFIIMIFMWEKRRRDGALVDTNAPILIEPPVGC